MIGFQRQTLCPGFARSACVALTMMGTFTACRPAAVVHDTSAKRVPARAPDPGATIEGCQAKPATSGLVVSCVADRFALELPGLSEGFVWSLRRPADPSQTHLIFVAEDTRKSEDLYSLSVLVGPESDEGRSTSSQLIALFDRLRQEAREAGRSDPGRAHNLSPAQPCQMTTNRQPCLLYQVRGVTIDGKPALSTHGWSASRREDGSVLFFHVAWAGYAGPHRAEHRKTLAKVDKQVRSLLDASYVIDASGRRLIQ
jgi:hypothetical protein